MTIPNVRHKTASADAPVFDAGEITKMAADPPSPSLAELEARLPFQKPLKRPRLTYMTREAFAKADARYYRGRVVGSSAHRAASRIGAFARDNGLSVQGGFLSLRDRSAGQKFLDQADAAAPKPCPPMPEGIRSCAHCHEKLPYRMRADAKFCRGGDCEKLSSRHAKRAALEAAEKVFRTDQMIAVNSAHAGLDLDRPYTSAEAEWIAWEVRHANRGTYVRPECGRKAANSYR